MRVRINVDRGICASNGLCALSAPEVFMLDDDLVLHYDQRPDEVWLDDVRAAIESCPVRAITFVEFGAGGGLP